MIRLKEKHRTFTNAFRIMAIKLEALPGVMAKDIAEILEIHPFMLSRWKKQYRDGKFVNQDTDTQVLDRETAAELTRLRAIEKKHQKLLKEHDLLKKVIAVSSGLDIKTRPTRKLRSRKK